MKPKLVKSFEFSTSELAWSGLNKYFLLRETEIVERGGIRSGTQMISHNIFLKIRKGYIDPEFDFAYMFGYKKQKWNRLIANYVDLNYLDLVKAEVLQREAKNQANYNVSFIFDNAHVTGHGCLINLTFIRRSKQMYPILQFTLRSSEITKRLIFDFLLVQRMGEYVLGEGKHFGIEVFLPNAFTTSEGVIMMDNYFNIEKIVKKWEEDGNQKGPFLEKTLNILKRFKEVDVNTIKYKVHQRTVKQLQKVNGVPISNSPELKSKNLFIV